MSDQPTMWQFLQDAPLEKYSFGAAYRTYHGRYLEKLARRVIKDWMTIEQMATLFPDVEVISSERYHPYGYGRKYGKIFRGKAAMKSQVDSLFALHVKKADGTFGKYAAAFEIKSGASSINKEHCTFWRDFILQPGEYIEECEKVRLFIFWIHGMDDSTMFYTLKEILPEEFPEDRNSMLV